MISRNLVNSWQFFPWLSITKGVKIVNFISLHAQDHGETDALYQAQSEGHGHLYSQGTYTNIFRFRYYLSGKHEIVLKCFCLNQNLIRPWSLCEKSLIIFFQFLPEFWCSNIFVVTEQSEHAQNQFFVARYLKFVFIMFTLDLLDGILGGFFEIPIICSRKLHFN